MQKPASSGSSASEVGIAELVTGSHGKMARMPGATWATGAVIGEELVDDGRRRGLEHTDLVRVADAGPGASASAFRHSTSRLVDHHTSFDEWISTRDGPSVWARAASRAGRSSAGVRTEKPVPPHRRAYSAEVGVDEVRLPHRADGAELLPADLGQLAVVQHDVGEREAVLHRGGEVGQVLAEAAVAGDRHHLAAADPCPAHAPPTRRWPPAAEADRAEVARHQHVLAAAALEEAAEGVGVVADVDGDDRVLGQTSPSTANTSAGCIRPWCVGEVARWAFSARHRAHRCATAVPLRRPLDAAGTAAEQGQRAADVAPQRHLDGVELAERSCGRGRPGSSAPRWRSTCGWRTRRPAPAGSRPAAW